MSAHAIVLAALKPVLANTWAVELPPAPTFPAIVFDIDTEPESGWCAGGGYDQHTVNIIAMGSIGEAINLIPAGAGGPLRTALQALGAMFMYEENSGDSDYEPNAEVYARFLTVRLRILRY